MQRVAALMWLKPLPRDTETLKLKALDTNKRGSKIAQVYRRLIGSFSSSAHEVDLPENIKKVITTQQDESERLIGWIQISILLVFSLLYLATPNTRPLGAEFEPVPMVLSAYFLFTCLRLLVAYRSRLSNWMLVLSVLADMGLLMGLIWSFHLQYMQPPSFYLKAPTLLYIFIFISLRALRFEPGFVLLSGLIGGVGWLFLVILAVLSKGAGSLITSDYVHYLTSNTVLIGAEIDKIMSIFVVTVILSLAVARARRLLIRSVVEQTSARNLSQFVPESVAAQIVQADGPLIDEKTQTREATVLFLDLVSFTSLAERLSPSNLITTLNEYFHVISEPIERNHGVINQFQGDAILASFNLPTHDPDHASSAVAAALEIEKILQNHKFAGDISLSVRAGINTGRMVGGFVGTPNRLSYTVYGDHVNIAARLQELSKEKNTNNLISLRTQQLCHSGQFLFYSKGSVVLRGRHSELEVFEAKFI